MRILDRALACADDSCCTTIGVQRLVRMLSASTAEVGRLNASLPTDFFERRSVMKQDCEAVANFGKKISAALFEYEADCFRIQSGGGNCTFKLFLGQPWDEMVDTPFDWTGQGLLSCNNSDGAYGDFNVNSSFRCAFCSSSTLRESPNATCVSPAMIRMTVCPSEVWWPQGISSALRALSMCQSDSQDCSRLCYGHTNWNGTLASVERKGLVPLLREEARQQGRQVSLFLSLERMKQVLLPLDEVVKVCSTNLQCPDETITGRLNVTTNVCMRASHNSSHSCRDYSGAMKDLVASAPEVLTEYNRTIDSFCPPTLGTASECERKLEEYGALCKLSAFSNFCKRQRQYLKEYPKSVGKVGMFV
jgi:hypothetical protein